MSATKKKPQVATLIAAETLSLKHLGKELSDLCPVCFTIQANNHHPDQKQTTQKPGALCLIITPVPKPTY